VKVESRPGAGTRFKLGFPLHREAGAAVQQSNGVMAA